MVQIPEEFQNRTEYRILKKYCPCYAMSIRKLHKGLLLLPGVILSKLAQEELDIICRWTESKENQLILTPAWIEIKLQSIFNASVSMEIKKVNSKYEEIPVTFHICTHARDIIFQQDGNIYGIHYRRNTGSGLITVITLPLLDYSLLSCEDKLKKLFLEVLKTGTVTHEETVETKEEFFPEDTHIYLMLLINGEINNKGFITGLQKYFNIIEEEESVRKKYEDLVKHSFIQEDKLTGKAVELINRKKMKAFARVIRERELSQCEWTE
jgi:hypothetical protein